MSWTNYFVYVIWLTGLTGIAWAGIWFIARMILKWNGNAPLIYRLLKFATIGYFVPFLFMWEFVNFRMADSHVGFLFVVTRGVENIIGIIFVTWLFGVAVSGSCFLLKRMPLYISRKATVPVSEKEEGILKQVCKELRIKTKVRVCHGYRVASPFIYGVLQPCIYLPVSQIPEDELEMIFRHELTHYKHRDVFWKSVYIVISCLYWFNPFVWLMLREFGRWSEASCDVKCCEKYKPSVYFSVVYKMMTVESQKFGLFAPNWYEGENELEWRVNNMRRNKMMKKWLSVAITVCVVAVSTVSTYAAEREVKKAYDTQYMDTIAKSEEGTEDTEYEEYTMDLNDLEGIEIIEIETDNSGIGPLYSLVPIDWTAPAKSGVSSNLVPRNAGETLLISVTLDPADKYLKVGYIDSAGVFHYVRGCNYVAHTFTISMNGGVKVCIMNDENNVKVRALGSYR